MPAVTVKDVLTLPRVPEPDPTQVDRPVTSVTTAPSGYEGEGFPVRRAFAGVDLRALDPFIHMDQMGEVDYAPGEPKGTPWHPHRGFETVTYMIDGIIRHQDSNGGGGLITDGDTQWMTAGSGLLHIEAPPEEVVVSGGLFHGFQLWVNLPKSAKMTPPRYQDLRAEDLPKIDADGVHAVVIAGEAFGVHGPADTHVPIVYVHVRLDPGASAEIPTWTSWNAFVFGVSGSGNVGSDRRPVREGQAALFGAGDKIEVRAGDEPFEVLVLAGQPLNEPVARYGPFVMNTKSEIIEAIDDFQSGRMGAIS
jgi:quercetin 2,3-dioxygenase